MSSSLALVLSAWLAAAPMSADELEGYAVEHSPLMALARLGHDVAEAEYLRASLAWVPTLKVSAGGGYLPGQTVDSTGRLTSDFSEVGYVARVEAEASMPLYTFGKLALLDDLGEAGRDLAAEKARVLEVEVRQQVRRLIENLRFVAEAEVLAREGRSYFDKAKKRLDKLEADDADEYDQIDSFKLRVYEADITRLELELQRGKQAAREALAALAGLPGPEALELAEAPLQAVEAEPGQVEAWVAALEGAPEVRVLGVESRFARLQADLEKRRWWPDLALLGYGKYQRADPVDNRFNGQLIYDPYNTWYAGAVLGLKWELDVVGRLAAVRKQRALQSLAEQKQDLYRRKLALDVRDLSRKLDDQRQMIRVTKGAEKAARSWLVDRSNLYDSGLIEVKEVVEALKEYYKRKEDHLRAVLELNLTWHQIVKLVGHDGRPL
jgi:outer membrane protein TolC